jgi:general secretion pathway protein L
LTDALLLFLDREAGFSGWLRLAGGAVAARGPGLDGLPADRSGARIVAVVPGEQVALHWLDLPPGLSPAQAAGAARLMSADASAQPLADLHVAVGETRGAGACVALVPAAAMAEWLGRLQAHGLDPQLMLPETALLAEPEGGLARYDRGGLSLYRGAGEAFAIEPDVAELVLRGRAVALATDEAFEAGLAAAVERPLVDLRQGAFGRRRTPRLEGARVRRLALLALGLVLASLAVQAAAILRYTFAADALEAETRRVAAAALPRHAGVTDASADLSRRLAELRGGGAGYGATAAALFGAVRATPNVSLSALSFSPDGSLRASVQADDPASLAALGGRLEADGFAVERGAPRRGGGRLVQALTVRPR